MDIRKLLGLAPSQAGPASALIPTARTASNISRRSFLKGAATVAVATTAAIYIPASRLEYVPRQITRDLPDTLSPVTWKNQFLTAEEIQYGDTIPMMMLVDTFYVPYGGILRQNDTVQVRQRDAGRWLDNGIAIPTPGSAIALQPDTTRRALDAAVRTNGGYPSSYRTPVFRTGSGSYLGSYSDDQYFKEFPQARSQQIQATSPEARRRAVADSMAPWRSELEAEVERIQQRRTLTDEGRENATINTLWGSDYDDLWEDDG